MVIRNCSSDSLRSNKLEVNLTAIKDVLIIEPVIYKDERGLFTETYSEEKYCSYGIKEKFVQDNYSHSKKNTARGLHYQLDYPQGKLVRVLSGTVLDVVLDIRRGSPTFGKHIIVELNDIKLNQLYLPPGVAHGFFVKSDFADFEYKCTDYYHPEDEYGVSFNDPILDIELPSEQVIISSQDKSFVPLNEIPENQLPSMF